MSNGESNTIASTGDRLPYEAPKPGEARVAIATILRDSKGKGKEYKQISADTLAYIDGLETLKEQLNVRKLQLVVQQRDYAHLQENYGRLEQEGAARKWKDYFWQVIQMLGFGLLGFLPFVYAEFKEVKSVAIIIIVFVIIGFLMIFVPLFPLFHRDRSKKG